jgi:hypothetical protein
MLKKDSAGFTLLRPRPFVFTQAVSIHIPESEAQRWRLSFTKILQRVKDRRFHTLPLSWGLRCIIGCWQFSVRTVRYFGGVRGLPYHVIGVSDSLYLLAGIHEWAAFPMSRNELETIESQFA